MSDTATRDDLVILVPVPAGMIPEGRRDEIARLAGEAAADAIRAALDE